MATPPDPDPEVVSMLDGVQALLDRRDWREWGIAAQRIDQSSFTAHGDLFHVARSLRQACESFEKQRIELQRQQNYLREIRERVAQLRAECAASLERHRAYISLGGEP